MEVVKMIVWLAILLAGAVLDYCKAQSPKTKVKIFKRKIDKIDKGQVEVEEIEMKRKSFFIEATFLVIIWMVLELVYEVLSFIKYDPIWTKVIV